MIKKGDKVSKSSVDIFHGIVLSENGSECVVEWTGYEGMKFTEETSKDFIMKGHLGIEHEKELSDRETLRVNSIMKCIVCEKIGSSLIWHKRARKRGVWFCAEHFEGF